MDYTFEITNQDKLKGLFDVIKDIDFEQLKEAIKKVEQDMAFLSVTNKRIVEMNNNDIMWDDENQRIKIKMNKTQQEQEPEKIYNANLGAFNRLVINNCGLETDYREYEEFKDMIIGYIRKEVSGKHPSVMELIDGLVQTLKEKYGVELKNFMQIEELQKVDPKRRKMIAKLMFYNNTENQAEANGVTSPTPVIKPSDIGPR